MLRILLIDDNPDDRLIATQEIEQEFVDVVVIEITNRPAFDQALSSESFDLVITDYQLGWSNGLEILATLKERDRHCPVIMLTGTGNEEIAVRAMKLGLDDYIIKSSRQRFQLAIAIRSALERVAARQQITKLENRLQSLLDHLNVGVFRATINGQLLESNKAFLQLIGLNSLEAVQAFNVRDIFWGEIDPVQSPQSREILLSQPDGQQKWVLLSQSIDTSEGEIAINGLVEEITELKQAELALRQLNDFLENRVSERTSELESINAQLEAFAYSVSHDLRAPLRAIQGFSELLLRDNLPQLQDNGKLYLSRIVDAAALMETLIDNLLDYSRLSRANLPLEAIDLNASISEALAQLSEEIQSKQAQITVEPNIPQVLGHPATVLRVLLNLISNAIKFVEPGVSPQIQIQAEEVQRRFAHPLIRLWVEDNGIGIDSRFHKQIFGVFERLHGVETYPGIGIGLALAQKGIERMNGQIGVESALGEGSRFWIELYKYQTGAESTDANFISR